VDKAEQAFLECMAYGYAYMPLPQLRELRAFLSTDSGKRLWDLSNMGGKDTYRCSRSVFRYQMDTLSKGAWKLIGAKPPKLAPPPA
jgi:hypothetical protein